MDTQLNQYRTLVKQVILQHAEYTPSRGDIHVQPVFDDEQEIYALIDSGWDLTGRVYAVILDIRFQEERIWIEVDGTEKGVAYDLIEAGVSQDDIVLGYLHPKRRELVQFEPV